MKTNKCHLIYILVVYIISSAYFYMLSLIPPIAAPERVVVSGTFVYDRLPSISVTKNFVFFKLITSIIFFKKKSP